MAWQLQIVIDEQRAVALSCLMEATCAGLQWQYSAATEEATYTFDAPPWLGLIDATCVWLAALGAADATLRSRQAEHEPWAVGWRGWFHPARLSQRFAIALSGQEADADALCTLYLEPGGGFGSGHHPSTGLALAVLDGALAERPFGTVLDVGCGTGLLAIAAAKLGWTAVGIDIEPLAVQRAGAHAAANQVAAACLWRDGGLIEGDRAEVVVANMPAGCLIDLGPRLVAAAEVDLVLAGLDLSSRGRVIAATHPLEVVAEGRDGDWVGLWMRRP